MAQILNGRLLADTIRESIKQRVLTLPTQPGLAVILVGNDPASHTYVRLKKQACEEVGIKFEQFLYPADEPDKTIILKIRELNERRDINGILVQLPLPSQDTDAIIQVIDPQKDVDGFHLVNIENLKQNKPTIAPAVALGIIELINETKVDLRGKTAVIVASGRFAEPIVALLAQKGVTSIVCPKENPDFPNCVKKGDILIVAEGQPGLIKGEMLKPGAIVIDVGITKIDGHLLGDVDRASAELIAGYLTPVPGGVGPMTVAMLLENVLKAWEIRN